MEKKLIEKKYHETYMEQNKSDHPIETLGEIFMEEQQNNLPDLSNIRFAQGEIYYHAKDYEAAIFKWENITNELEPWAKKNMGDAYYRLGLLSMAEDIYKEIQTDSLLLNTEVGLNLFSLYIEREKQDSALLMIKKVVAENPDYPNVTELAKTFFENQEEWMNAIELAVNEALRTKSIKWFECLKEYVDKGLTKSLHTSYFLDCLSSLFEISPSMFENLVRSIWNSYKKEDGYFSWLKDVNGLLFNIDPNRNPSWKGLSKQFKESFFDLIGGTYLIKQIKDIVPLLLSNWLRFSSKEETIIASTAVLSWNDLFPSTIDMETIASAEESISYSEKNVEPLDGCIQLFHSIMEWAENHEIGTHLRLKWMFDKLLDFNTQTIFIAGQAGIGKSTFIDFIVGDGSINRTSTTTVTLYRHDSRLGIDEINDNGALDLTNRSEFEERMNRRRNALDSVIEFKCPNSFLYENGISFLDSPGLNEDLKSQREILKYLNISDILLFVLDVNNPLSDKDKKLLSNIRDISPELSIHFLLNRMDMIEDEQETIQIFDRVSSAIQSYFPESKLFAFSSEYETSKQLSDLNEFVKMIIEKPYKEKRIEKCLNFVRFTITNLLQKRMDLENYLIESARWNEEMVGKINGAIHQILDLKTEKYNEISRKLHDIRGEVQKRVEKDLPKLLQDCSKLIQEESNLSKIHIELNSEMNRRIQHYIEHDILPNYVHALYEWTAEAREDLAYGKEVLIEMADGFNAMYGEERVRLECDMKILDDWRRDIDRMTCGFQLEEVNILLRRTPLQLMLKSAGKIFGAFSQNNSMLYHKYKAFVESEDYSDTVRFVSQQFFQPFDLFEKSLERDIALFFRNSLNVLTLVVEKTQNEIQNNKEALKKMNTNPEIFRDPITLFELRLRQLEWMTLPGKGIQSIYQ